MFSDYEEDWENEWAYRDIAWTRQC
jgi:hypothetical protein